MAFIKAFFQLPCPGLTKHWRILSFFFSMMGFIICGMWLNALNWPDTNTTSSAILLIPLLMISIPLGFVGAVLGSISTAIIIFSISDLSLSSTEAWMRIMTYSIIALSIAAYAHLQGYYQRKLYFLSMHNPATQLPGRLALWKELDQQLTHRSKGVFQNGLAIIEIVNFKDICSTFSYEAADKMIMDLWQRLVDVFYPGAQAYHYLRERLAVLFHSPGDDLEELMSNLRARFDQSVTYDGVPIHFDSLIGFVRLNGKDGRYVINQAEAAIEYARENGRLSQIYSSGMERDRKKELILLGDLFEALKNGSMRLYYQPKVALKSMQLVGFEALARWEHPSLGKIPPDQFIPLVERTDCIHTFSLWAFEQALLTFKNQWPHRVGDITIAVNISSRNLANRDFPKQIHKLLQKYELPPNTLELEVTEREIMKNPELSVEVLQALADIPMVISIDDFGTGYSSLAYLHRLPATIIKVDRTFIGQLNHNSGVFQIVLSTINLAHALGMKVVAEGIETEQQLSTLKELGCDIGQGYYFSPAIPIEQAANWNVNQ